MASTSCYQQYKDALTGLLFKHPFYFYTINQLLYEETDSDDIPVAAVAPEISKGTFRLILNKNLYPRLTLPGAMFVFAHEVLHVIYNHCFDELRKDRYWPLAIDMSVNSILIKDGLTFPTNPDDPSKPFGTTIQTVVEYLEAAWAAAGQPKKLTAPPENLPAQAYLAWIYENLPPSEGQGQGQGQEQGKSQPDNGSGEPGNGEGEGQGKSLSEMTPDEILEALEELSKHEWPDVPPEEREVIKQIIAEKVQQAMKQATPPGSIAGACDELIQSLKPQISWEQKLRKFTGMLGGLEMKPSMAYENKYGQTPRVVFKPSKRLLVAVDTSGSVWSDTLAQFMGEVEAIAKDCTVDLMWVDYEVHEVKPFVKDAKGYAAKGRGGTDMRKIFKWIRDNKQRYDGVIVLTDLETPFPTYADRMGIKTLWVGCRNHPVPPEAGEVVYLPSAQQGRRY